MARLLKGGTPGIDEVLFKRAALGEAVAGERVLGVDSRHWSKLLPSRSNGAGGVSWLDLILGPKAAALNAHGIGVVE